MYLMQHAAGTWVVTDADLWGQTYGVILALVCIFQSVCLKLVLPDVRSMSYLMPAVAGTYQQR